MEKSIPLKEIVGFLPYGLQIYRLAEANNPQTVKLTTGVLMLWEDNYYDEFKPIVRPLSDLTKEITHNGENFVPIVKIAEMLGYDNLIKFDEDSGYEFIEYGYIERYEDDQQPYVFGYWKDGLFGFWYDEQDDTCPINHFTNLSAINLLHELHFDIYDWIKDGKAIDINTLKP